MKLKYSPPKQTLVYAVALLLALTGAQCDEEFGGVFNDRMDIIVFDEAGTEVSRLAFSSSEIPIEDDDYGYGPPNDIKAADLNDDGNDELVITTHHGELVIYDAQSNSVVFETQTGSFSSLKNSMVFFDVDEDGDADILINDLEGSLPIVTVLLNETADAISFGDPVVFSPDGFDPSDYRNRMQWAKDESDNYVLVGILGGEVKQLSLTTSLELREDFGISLPALTGCLETWTGFAPGDLNADGKTDIIIYCRDPEVTVDAIAYGFDNTGAATEIDLGDKTYTSKSIARDYDGDGIHEIPLATSEQPNTLEVFLSNFGTTAEFEYIYQTELYRGYGYTFQDYLPNFMDATSYHRIDWSDSSDVETINICNPECSEFQRTTNQDIDFLGIERLAIDGEIRYAVFEYLIEEED